MTRKRGFETRTCGGFPFPAIIHDHTTALMTETLLQLAGGILCLMILGQMVLLMIATLRRMGFEKRRQVLATELLRAQLEAAKKIRQRKEEAAGWNGWRKFTIARKVRDAGNVCSFHLTPHDHKSIPAYLPGQYLTFRLDIPGQQKEVIRCYSLSDRPRAGHYRVTIKKLPPPRDRPDSPGGLVSGFFHDQVKEGDIVDVKAPGGHFVLETAKKTPVVLIAGGVGLTPLLSMLNEIVEGGSQRETWFFFGITDASEHLMRDHLLAVARAHDNVRLRVHYSKPEPDRPDGHDCIYGGRITLDALKKTLPSNNYTFYICGPPPMMSDLTRGLKEWGVPEHHVMFEAFGPASVKSTPAPPAAVVPAPAGLKVTFAKSARETTWDGQTGSLLEFAEALGISINSGCRAGNCGTCLTALKSGEVTYVQETGARPEPGSCLACVCIPKTDVVLDA